MQDNEDTTKANGEQESLSKIPRRTAMQFVGFGGACMMLTPGEALAGDETTRNRMGESYDWDAKKWSKKIGSQFAVADANGETSMLELIEVIEEDWASKDPNRSNELRPSSLSLIFSGPGGLESQNYQIRLTAVESHIIHLNPIGRHGTRPGTTYEIILN